MKAIQVLKTFHLNTIGEVEDDKELKEIFNGAKRRLVEVKLQNGAVLEKHKAFEPITVFCLAGSGVFRAGKDLEEAVKLQPGALITLEAEVEHEVIAEPYINLLVSKFKTE